MKTMRIYRLALSAMHKLKEASALEEAGEITGDCARTMRHAIWGKVGYDVHLGFVIAAEGERQARLVAQAAADEAHRPSKYPSVTSDAERGWWLDSKQSICEHIGEASGSIEESVILGSFRSG